MCAIIADFGKCKNMLSQKDNDISKHCFMSAPATDLSLHHCLYVFVCYICRFWFVIIPKKTVGRYIGATCRSVHLSVRLSLCSFLCPSNEIDRVTSVRLCVLAHACVHVFHSCLEYNFYILMDEYNTIQSAYTLYRHLG